MKRQIIGINRTRYSSEGLQKLVDAVVQAAQVNPKITRDPPRYRSKKEDDPFEVGYWTGNMQEGRREDAHYGSPSSPGPWFTSPWRSSATTRLLLVTPEKAVRGLSPLYQLASVPLDEDKKFMHVPMKEQVVLLIAARLQLRCPDHVQGRAGRSYTRHLNKHLLAELMKSPDVQAAEVEVLKNIVDPKAKNPDSRAYISRLWNTFTGGRVRRIMDENQRMIRRGLTEYAALIPKLEKPRQRLIDRGESPNAILTPIELLELEILRLERQGGQG